MRISQLRVEESPEMVYLLTWLAGALEEVGLKVAEVPGWQSRGRAEMGTVLGVMCHHTGTAHEGNMPTLDILVTGRSDLPGPLAQLGLGRDGTYYVIAAGRCNHAGKGAWKGVTLGNANFIGIEAENSGTPADPWPAVQVEAYQRGVAAILRHVDRSAEFCCGHKEYALPAGRKVDPSFDMASFRVRVAAILGGAVPAPALIPAVEPAAKQNAIPRPTLRRGAMSPLVREVQQKLNISPPDGVFGARTEAEVRKFQRTRSLVPDGIIGPKTWALLDALSK
jgi:N-acetylmuramoyl-L-alanine amidase/Putative peptidoglycan binding domain